MVIESSIYIAVAAMGGIGFLFAAFLAIADKKLRVKEDPLIEKLMDALPGTNCGACGFAGCQQLAEKVAIKEVPVNACPAGGQEVTDAVAEALGVEALASVKILAVVLCRGGEAEAVKNAVYRGERTCSAAMLAGGEKSCSYGCLGLGECVDSCPFDAMAMDDNGLPVIFYDKCVGCGNCARACPNDIIEMHPEDRKLFVYCRNKDKGPAAKKSCKTACIGCSLCVKDSEVKGAIAITNNLATIDYESCPQDETPIKRCPTKCILFGEEELMTREHFFSTAGKEAEVKEAV